MLIFLGILAAVSLVAIGASLVQFLRDGYGRVSDRQEPFGQSVRGELLRHGSAPHN